MEVIIFIIVAYLLGSISSAVIISKLTGKPDPRSQGSGNAGATNVLRISGKNTALLVLISDVVKGLIAVWLAKMFGVFGFGLGLVAVAVVVGHIFPAFFKFQGGKGVAPALGAILGLSLFVGILVLVTWLVVAYFTRYASLSSLISSALACIYTLLFSQAAYFIPLVIMAALIAWKHKQNIDRLRTGSEPKIGS